MKEQFPVAAGSGRKNGKTFAPRDRGADDSAPRAEQATKQGVEHVLDRYGVTKRLAPQSES